MKRHLAIDLLRGLSMLAIVIIHVNAYYLKIKIAHDFWNWNQYAVVIFVFCSAYLYFKKAPLNDFTFHDFIFYVKKRLTRLLIPYYIFLFGYFLFLFLIHSAKLNPPFVIQSLLTIGGVDLNWLVLLFIYFIFLFPLIAYLSKKKRLLYFLLTTVSLGSTIYFLFFPSPLPYRYLMWLPWSTIAIFTQSFVENEQKKNYIIKGMVISGIIFLLTLGVQIYLKHPLDHYQNKYPPNIYHLSYGIFCLFLFYILAQMVDNPASLPIKLLTFMSKNSYSLFFIHFLLLLMMQEFYWQRYFSWEGLFLVILSLSILLQWAGNLIQKSISFRH